MDADTRRQNQYEIEPPGRQENQILNQQEYEE
jgi:hypothetical protein